MPSVINSRELTILKASASVSQKDTTSQRHFYVQLDGKPADPLDVLAIAAAVIPDIGDAYAGGSPLTCNKLTPSSMGTTTDFLIVADYSVPVVDFSYEPNPVDRPDELEYAGSSRDQNYFLDSTTPDAKPSTNKWGEPFDPLPTCTGGELTIRIKGNRASINAPLWASYFNPRHSINNASFSVRGLSLATGTAKLISFRAATTVEKTHTFLACEWELSLAPNWNQTFEHRGFIEFGDTKFRRIVRGDPKAEIEKPWPYDATGSPLAHAYDTPATLTRSPYPKRDFSIFDWTA